MLHHRQSAVGAMNRNGIRIDSDDGTTSVSVPATTDATDVTDADLALVFVTAQQTVDSLEWNYLDCGHANYRLIGRTRSGSTTPI